MSFFILTFVFLIQHFLTSKMNGVFRLLGLENLLEGITLEKKSHRQIYLVLWFAVPFAVLGWVHWYLSLLTGGMGLFHLLFFVLTFFAFNYDYCRQLLQSATTKVVLSDYDQSPATPHSAEQQADEKSVVAVLNTLRCAMVPLFWIFAFNIYGSLLVFLMYHLHVLFSPSPWLGRAQRLIEWLPMRLLAINYCLECRFEAIWGALKLFVDTSPSDVVARNFVVPQVLKQTNLKRNNPQLLLVRQVASWIAVMAMMTLLSLL